MKKAKLEIQPVFGTFNTICVYLTYQGRVLVDFAGHRHYKDELVAKAQTWATNQGYALHQPQLHTV